MAYMDIFRWTAVLSLVCAGACWLFKKQPPHTAPPEGVHSGSSDSCMSLQGNAGRMPLWYRRRA